MKITMSDNEGTEYFRTITVEGHGDHIDDAMELIASGLLAMGFSEDTIVSGCDSYLEAHGECMDTCHDKED